MPKELPSPPQAWPRSGGPRQVGETRMALEVGAAVHSLAAVAERRKIARIAGRPAAGACRQVDDGEAAVDRLLIGEIGSERYPPSIVSAAATSIRAASVLGIAHWALEFEEAPGFKRGCDAPSSGNRIQIFQGMPDRACCRRSPIVCFFRPSDRLPRGATRRRPSSRPIFSLAEARARQKRPRSEISL